MLDKATWLQPSLSSLIVLVLTFDMIHEINPVISFLFHVDILESSFVCFRINTHIEKYFKLVKIENETTAGFPMNKK